MLVVDDPGYARNLSS